MPDALPPVGVLLATLDAATLPLAGTETTFVMQGGQPKQTPVSSIGKYARSGTYTPTVTTGGGATVAPYLLTGYSRVGNGAGVPLAGDTVCVFGFFGAAGLTDGDVVTVTLPFALAPATGVYISQPVMNGSLPSDLAARGDVGSQTTIIFTFTVTGSDGDSAISFSVNYQTANAVDP